MKTFTQDEITEITKAVHGYNLSPWNEFDQMSVEDVLKNTTSTVQEILEKIRREDIRGYRAEEARNGNI
jgi:hypothetical protein